MEQIQKIIKNKILCIKVTFKIHLKILKKLIINFKNSFLLPITEKLKKTYLENNKQSFIFNNIKYDVYKK